jgi:hypothetical protein
MPMFIPLIRLPEFHTPFTDMPDSLTLWAKYFPTDNDMARITAVLHADTAKVPDSALTNWVAFANITIDEQVGDWTRFSAPFVYLNNDTPEYILFAMFAGDAANAINGSTLYLDDLELIYYNTGTSDKHPDVFQLFMEGEQLRVVMDQKYFQEEFEIEVFDLTGRSTFSTKFTPAIENIIQPGIPSGIYLCKIQNGNYIRIQKFLKK